MKIDKSLFIKLELLSRISIDISLQNKLREKLESYIDFMGLFSEFDSDPLAENDFNTEEIVGEIYLRKDDVIDFNFRSAFLNNAPGVHNGEILVPEVVQRT